MIRNFIFTLCILVQYSLSAQSKMVFENYNYLGQPGSGSVVPMMHFETKNNWYAELRYNYEEVNTLSFFGGKTFSPGGEKRYGLTPLAGFSVGDFTGVSAGLNIDAEWDKTFLASQSQYSMATKQGADNFFFNWSELGCDLSNNFFGGLAVQLTLQHDNNSTEPGFFAGLNFSNISIPVYVFSPFTKDRYFVIGIYYEYTMKGKKRHSGLKVNTY